MTFKEILETIAASLTILVSLIVLYGAFMGAKRKIFQRLHKIIEIAEEKLHIEK